MDTACARENIKWDCCWPSQRYQETMHDQLPHVRSSNRLALCLGAHTCSIAVLSSNVYACWHKRLIGALTLKASTAPSPFECCTVGDEPRTMESTFCDRLQLVLEILRTKVKHSAPLVLHQSAVISLRDSTVTDAVKFLVEDVHSPLLRIRSLLGLSWGSPAARWHRQPGPLRRSQSQPLHAAPHWMDLKG